jgi:outer membrane protein assembly factor BamB
MPRMVPFRRHWRPWLLPAGAVLLAGLACWLVRPARLPARPAAVQLVWMFDPGRPGSIAASPVVAGDRLYLATIHDRGLSAPQGVVLALDRRTRKVIWSFDDSGRMLHTISTPILAAGRLYVGEGMHGDLPCHLYCLDAATGRRLWAYPAGGHIEAGPQVAEGRVYFAAGDDGIYALDAATGELGWHYTGPVHVDTRPAVANGRLFAGGGISRRFDQPEAFCLDARSGKLLWRQSTDLPVWGSPVVVGDSVLFGLGNGRLTRSVPPPEKPAGALVCLAVQTGDVRWRYRTADAVFSQPAGDGSHVYFTCRDGNCFCLDVATGRLVWKQPLGSPAVATPALEEGRLYALATAGQVHCLEAASGRTLWSHDVGAGLEGETLLLSSPVVVRENGRRRLLFGGEVRAGRSYAVLYCLEERGASE